MYQFSNNFFMVNSIDFMLRYKGLDERLSVGVVTSNSGNA
jgi:hypothetical protein